MSLFLFLKNPLFLLSSLHLIGLKPNFLARQSFQLVIIVSEVLEDSFKKEKATYQLGVFCPTLRLIGIGMLTHQHHRGHFVVGAASEFSSTVNFLLVCPNFFEVSQLLVEWWWESPNLKCYGWVLILRLWVKLIGTIFILTCDLVVHWSFL